MGQRGLLGQRALQGLLLHVESSVNLVMLDLRAHQVLQVSQESGAQQVRRIARQGLAMNRGKFAVAKAPHESAIRILCP